MKFPVDFQRRIPSLETLAYFKASEHKNLLLYGILPALFKFLLDHQTRDDDVINFIHWIAIYIEIAVRLNADVIELDSLVLVDRLVEVWQQLLPEFLGEDSQTFNSHATCHLTHFVRNLGPLHNYSTFAFESFNYVYANMVTSAHGTLEQVARRFTEKKFIKSWFLSSVNNKELAEITNSICGKSLGNSASTNKYGSVKLISKTEMTKLQDDEVTALESAFGIRLSSVLTAVSAKVGSSIVRTKTFEKGKSMCTHIGRFLETESHFYAEIYKMFLHGNRVYALCKELRSVENFIERIPKSTNNCIRALWDQQEFGSPYGSSFHIVEASAAYRVVELEHFQKRCLLIDFGDFVVLTGECMSFEHN